MTSDDRKRTNGSNGVPPFSHLGKGGGGGPGGGAHPGDPAAAGAPGAGPQDVESESEEVDTVDAELPEVELGPTPERVKELIAACVRFVGARYGVALDGSPDTLSILDQYVKDARAELARTPDSLELLQNSVGAYLGEVMRQAFLGEWFAEGPPEGWRIDMRTVFLTFNPVGMAREALTLEPAEGWHAHMEMDAEDRPEIDHRLAQLGAVAEDEFYAPTTRYDVIDLAVATLRARMVERGLGDVRFAAEDYRGK